MKKILGTITILSALTFTAEAAFLVSMVRSTNGGFGNGDRNWEVWQDGYISTVRPNPAGPYSGHTFNWDINSKRQWDVIDFGNNGGNYGPAQGGSPGQTYANGGTTGDLSQYSTRAYAYVTFDPGDYTIGFGSDDGGYLTMTANGGDSGWGWTGWSSTGGQFNQNNMPPGLTAADVNGVGDDTIWFGNGRGHQWTMAQFSLTTRTRFALDTAVWEGGGGDSFELAIRGDHTYDLTYSAGVSELLSDGFLGITVTNNFGVVPEASTSISMMLGIGILAFARRLRSEGRAGRYVHQLK
ncbi:MAG: hypothetical protein ACI9QL_002604 [Candidatus Omnitrophota bacterium]|jgi:hypothetical protein